MFPTVGSGVRVKVTVVPVFVLPPAVEVPGAGVLELGKSNEGTIKYEPRSDSA